jgi:hypothetical protein
MKKDKNIFGGGNANAVYTPMSETEQEFLSRLRDSQELILEVKGFGEMPVTNFIIGDHRLGIEFTITFQTKDNGIQVVPFLDLVLRTRSKVVLYTDRQAFNDINGNPMMVSTGLSVPMQWDIGINKIDPEVIKTVMPHVGLTTRRGNEKFTEEQHLTYRALRKGEAKAKQSTVEMVEQAVERVKKPVQPVDKKIVT